jgi:hypothetical protein
MEVIEYQHVKQDELETASRRSGPGRFGDSGTVEKFSVLESAIS